MSYMTVPMIALHLEYGRMPFNELFRELGMSKLDVSTSMLTVRKIK